MRLLVGGVCAWLCHGQSWFPSLLSRRSPCRQTADVTVSSAVTNSWRISRGGGGVVGFFAVSNTTTRNLLVCARWFRHLCISVNSILGSRTAEWRECLGGNVVDSITSPKWRKQFKFHQKPA